MQNVFIARQAVFDRNQNVSSYELLFRNHLGVMDFEADADYMTSKVLVTALMDIGLDEISDKKMVHINASESFLLSSQLDDLPADKVSIEVLEDVAITDKVIARCKELKQAGYQIMLDDVVYAPQLKPLVELADVIKVELPLIKDLDEEVRILKQFNVKILAEKVETYEEYQRCYDLGFDYFQGYYFCKPEVIHHKTMPESKIAILRALQKVMSANVVRDVEDVIKQDVSLSYRLLKYMNSAAFGLRREVGSIDQALVLLGMNNVRRWLSLLSLAALGEGKPLELMRTALYRGYLLESLSKHSNEELAGDDFLLGMFSVLDALLDLPMAEAIDDMALSSEIRSALLSADAEMSYKLKLVYDLEAGAWDAVTDGVKNFKGMSSALLSQFNVTALAWADEQMQAI
ncbi:MAG: HDOD domain-containing protein [Mariprofundaceae bacterium]